MLNVPTAEEEPTARQACELLQDGHCPLVKRPGLGLGCWMRLGTARGSHWAVQGNQGLIIRMMVTGNIAELLWALFDMISTR